VGVSTAFNRLLPIPGASVIDVSIGDRDVEVTLRPHARRLQCPCGILGRAVYDRRRRRWRNLGLGGHRLRLVYEIRRLDCPECGVRAEELPWARPGARHTRDFEDMAVSWPSAPTAPRWIIQPAGARLELPAVVLVAAPHRHPQSRRCPATRARHQWAQVAQNRRPILRRAAWLRLPLPNY
jgi:hypothetical protein